MRITNDQWLAAALWLELERLADTDEDATTTIQHAFDAGVEGFPAGTYRVSSTIRVTSDA